VAFLILIFTFTMTSLLPLEQVQDAFQLYQTYKQQLLCADDYQSIK
jgi:hypothetical protein